LLVQGDARRRLGDVFASAIVRRDANTPAEHIERQRAKPMRSPLLVVVIAKIAPDNAKVPPFEQLLSAGAAAQHMQLAAQAMGYGSVWVTGANATDATVRAALGVQHDDTIVGFVHFGTPSIESPVVRRPAPQQFVERWIEPAARAGSAVSDTIAK